MSFQTLRKALATALAASAMVTATVVHSQVQAVSSPLRECNSTGSRPLESGSSYLSAFPMRRDSNGSTFNCYLRRGSTGPEVRALQRALASANGQRLTVDGVFGPATERALRNVQNRHRVEADGVYGPQTQRIMKWRWTSAKFSDVYDGRIRR